MSENEIQKSEEFEIDLRRIVEAVLTKTWAVVSASVAGAVLALAVTLFAITPEYEAAAMFYVNNNALSVGEASLSISSGDLSTSRNLVDSYIVILNTRETLNEVIDYAGSDLTFSELKRMIAAYAVNDTEIFQVTVTSTDPKEAEQIANAIGYILPKRISSIIEGTSAKVVEAATVPSSPSSPSHVKNALVGFLLGFVLSVGLIALREIFDISIRSEEDVARCCKHPILAAVPDMGAAGKGGSQANGSKRLAGKKGSYAPGKQTGRQPALVGDGVSFAASEAYKLLRTKLQFSFADENGGRIIGFTSALSGEGKSLTAVNLAHTLSQLKKKVILIDCDMRRPTLAEKLHIHKKPGLSSFLTGQSGLQDVVQYCSLDKGGAAFHAISAGQNPPNPIELLSSVRMEKMLEFLRKEYDYVIIDLPPVSEVSDALAVAKQTDGMLLVVRQNYCDRVLLSETVRQFEFINARILGVVFNGTSEHTGVYGKSYSKVYGKNYVSSYEHNDRSVSKPVRNKTSK